MQRFTGIAARRARGASAATAGGAPREDAREDAAHSSLWRKTAVVGGWREQVCKLQSAKGGLGRREKDSLAGT